MPVPLLLPFKLDELLEAVDPGAGVRHFSNDDIASEIAKVSGHDSVRVIYRGTSPLGRPISELVIRDPTPGPKQHIAWNTDPHARDERSSLVAAVIYARSLLSSPLHLQGRSLHILFSSPDDRDDIFAVQASEDAEPVLPPRNADVRQQSGWSLEAPGAELTALSSPGWHALDAMLRDIVEEISKRRDGSGFCLFISGHNSLASEGTHFVVGTSPDRELYIGSRLEATAKELGDPLCGIAVDSEHLRLIEGLSATFEADTAARRRAFDPTVRVRCSDQELAMYYARLHGITGLVTLSTESPENFLLPRDGATAFIVEEQARDDIHKIMAACAEASKLARSAGRIAKKSKASGAIIAPVLASLRSYAEADSFGSRYRVSSGGVRKPNDELLHKTMLAAAQARSLLTIEISFRRLSLLGSLGGEGDGQWEGLVPALNSQTGRLLTLIDRNYEFWNRGLIDQAQVHLVSAESAFVASVGLPFQLSRLNYLGSPVPGTLGLV